MKQKRVFLILGVIFLCIGMVFLSSCVKKEEKSEKTINIATILPLQGDSAIYGINILNGVKLAIEESNKANLFGDYKLRLISADGKGTIKDSISAYTNMRLHEKDIYLVYTELSKVCNVLAEYTDRDRILHLGIAASQYFINNFKYTLRNDIVSTKRLGQVLSEDSTNKFKFKKAGIVYVKDDYGLESMTSLKEQLAAKSINVPVIESYETIDKDFKNLAAKIVSNDIEILYFIGYGQNISNFVESLYSQRYNGIMYGSIEFAFIDFTKILEKFPGKIIYYLSVPLDESNINLSNFKKKYFLDYKKQPDLASFIGYSGIRIILSALGNLKSKNVNLFDIDRVIAEINGFNENMLYKNLKIINREIQYPISFEQVKGD